MTWTMYALLVSLLGLSKQASSIAKGSLLNFTYSCLRQTRTRLHLWLF